MEPQRLQIHLGIALKSLEIRKAVAALERLHDAYELLDGLSPAVLKCMADHLEKQYGTRIGCMGTFKRAYIALVKEHLEEARKAERRLFHGITNTDDED